MNDRRLFLFGLDGATFTLLRPWADEGHLPALARLMAGGAWGPLASTFPALTPIAWNSMVTGVYPGKHGVFGFVKRRPKSYEIEIITSRDRRRPAIWNLLSRAGLPSIVVDVPMTYPPEPIEGIMISGLGTPDVTAPFVHPPSLRDVILREFGQYPLDIYHHWRIRKGDILALLEDANRLTEHRRALVKFLMREFPWTFFMLGMMTTDRLQHVVWKYIDPGHPLYDPDDARRYGPSILDCYRRIDGFIGEVVERLDPQTAFLVASDHGFGPLKRSLSLPRWLVQQGLLALGGDIKVFDAPGHTPRFGVRGAGRVRREPADFTLRVDRPDAYAGAVFKITGLNPHRRYELTADITDATAGVLLEFDDLTRAGHPIIGGGPVRQAPAEITTVFQPQGPEMELMVCLTTYGGNPTGRLAIRAVRLSGREDWSRTAAYVLDVGRAKEGRSLRLNVRGREPQGIIEQGEEFVRTRNRIAAGIQDLRDAADQAAVRRVYTREDLYAGPYADEGPDLMVDFAEGVAGSSPEVNLSGLSADAPVCVPVTDGNSGNHRPEGVFIAFGPHIIPGQRVAPSIVDVCPTVLHLLGVPMPEDLDGRVVVEMLEVDHRQPAAVQAPVRAGSNEGPAESGEVYDDADRRKIEDRLRRLGYLE